MANIPTKNKNKSRLGKTIYIAREWYDTGDANDIVNYYKMPGVGTSIKYDIQIKTARDLINMPSTEILDGIIFADPGIIRAHIREELSPENVKLVIPDTYDCNFKDFYRRDIRLITLDILNDRYLANDESRFIKPLGNNKLFDGQIIDNYDDLDNLLKTVPGLSPTTLIYSSPIINIHGEIRLLIGNNKLYGRGLISIVEPPNQYYLNGFLDGLINCSAGRFLCVDIGWIPDLGSWVVIEINPPFALEDYEIPLTDYLAFISDSFEWIRSLSR